MSVKTNFFDGGGISYAAADMIAPFASLLSDGVFSGQNALAHVAANLSVDVQIGNAIKSGYFIKSDAVVNVAITANTSGYNRIDLIVLDIDTTGKVSTFKAVAGTPASSPVSPTAGALQLALARVLVGNNASTIDQNVITDVRAFIGTPYQNGWIPLSNTLTYATATTVTVSGDQTGIFHQGVKLMFTQGGTVIYYLADSAVYSSPNTTITIRPFDASTLANSAITAVYYSLAFAPVGFPINPPKIPVTFANSWANFGSGTVDCKYWKDALGYVHVEGMIKSGGLGSVAFTLPTGYRLSTLFHKSTVANSAFGDMTVNAGAVTPNLNSNAWFIIDLCYLADS